MDTTSYEQRVDFLRECIKKFGALGAFIREDPSRPVAWVIRKPGTDLDVLIIRVHGLH